MPVQSSLLRGALQKAMGLQEIVEMILHYSGVTEIFRFRRCSEETKRQVDDYLHRAYNIDRSLNRFFKDPDEFRMLQKDTGALISGSFALQFFDRVIWEEADLDLYVYAGSRSLIADWLQIEGYVYKPALQQSRSLNVALADLAELDTNPYGSVGVVARFNFQRRKRVVQMLVVSRSPMDTILCFYSTHVINAISYNAAYSLYAWNTLQKKQGLIVIPDVEEPQSESMEKYETRGWTFVENLRYPKFCSNIEERAIFDEHVWKMDFDISAVVAQGEEIAIHPHEVTTWLLRQDGYLRGAMLREVTSCVGQLPAVVSWWDFVPDLLASVIGKTRAEITHAAMLSEPEDEINYLRVVRNNQRTLSCVKQYIEAKLACIKRAAAARRGTHT